MLKSLPNHYLSLLTLNLYSLHSSVKRHRLTELIKKKSESVYLFLTGDTSQQQIYMQKLKMKGWKRILQANERKRNWYSHSSIRYYVIILILSDNNSNIR